MGKRSKDRKHLDFNGTKAEEGLCGIPNNTLGEKRKSKISQDVNDSDTGNLISLDGFPEGDTEVRSHKKRNHNQEDYNVSEQADVIHKKKKKKELPQGIAEDSNLNLESNGLALVNDGSHKKKKKRKLHIELDVEMEGNSNVCEHLDGTKIHKKNETKPQENQIVTTSQSLMRKKKKKVSVETVEQIELNNECVDAEYDDNTKTKKKKKKQHKTFNDLNQSLEETSIKKKKKKIAVESLEQTEYDNECIDVELVDNSKTKKKKKKYQKQDETINDLNQSLEVKIRDDKKKKNKGTEGKLSADSITQKIKPVTAKFNAEEAAVTEEEINQFCDEIDEEDNKQYEEWVRLLDSMLGPKKTHAD